MTGISDDVARLAQKLADLERVVANAQRQGTVHEVDAEKKTVRLRLGGTDDAPLLSAPVPYGQIAGALKVHSPPSVGQTMLMLSPGGDARAAVAIPLTWSTQNPSPSDEADEHVMTFGDVRVAIRGGEVAVTTPRLLVTAGGSTFDLTGAGLELAAEAIALAGDTLKHNGIGIGSDHVHTEVEKGGALSGPPPP